MGAHRDGNLHQGSLGFDPSDYSIILQFAGLFYYQDYCMLNRQPITHLQAMLPQLTNRLDMKLESNWITKYTKLTISYRTRSLQRIDPSGARLMHSVPIRRETLATYSLQLQMNFTVEQNISEMVPCTYLHMLWSHIWMRIWELEVKHFTAPLLSEPQFSHLEFGMSPPRLRDSRIIQSGVVLSEYILYVEA